MSTLLFANKASSTLAGAINTTATTINLASGSGALFPNPSGGQYFVLTLTDAATLLLNEVLWCTARSSDTLTVVRAQESTTALNWNAGDLVNMLWTAGQAAQMFQQGQAPSSQVYYGADTGSVNAMVSTVSPTIGALATGNIFEITPAFANTSPTVTLNISAIGAYNVYRADGTALLDGDIQAAPYKALIAWDGTATKFLLLNPCTWISQPPPSILSGNLTLYVSTTGSDSNNGLTSGTPFLTLQHAWNILVSQINLNGHQCTIQLADGTYGAGLLASTLPLGLSSISNIIIQGNNTNKDAVIISVSGTTINAQGPTGFLIQNMKLQSSGGSLLVAQNGAFVQFTTIDFGGAGGGSHLFSEYGGSIICTGNYEISGSAAAHFSAALGGAISVRNVTITLAGTPAFSSGFAAVGGAANVQADGNTFINSATGARYSISGNGVVYTNGASSTYFPGNASGTTGTGGQYY